MSRRFRLLMEESEEKRDSRLILALDVIEENPEKIFSRSMSIIEDTHEYICAIKINHHLILPLGLFNGVRRIIERARELELPTIVDCKANDIGSTNRVIAENYFKAGFDAIIANPFVGWEDGLQPIFDVADNMGRGVILLVYMSHKAAWEGYGQNIYDAISGRVKPQYIVFAEKALSWGADGVIVGATYPEKIREVYGVLGGSIPIYSPGVGVQGGDIEAAIAAGSHYLIIGRLIVEAEDPAEAAKKIRDRINRALKEARARCS